MTAANLSKLLCYIIIIDRQYCPRSKVNRQ